MKCLACGHSAEHRCFEATSTEKQLTAAKAELAAAKAEIEHLESKNEELQGEAMSRCLDMDKLGSENKRLREALENLVNRMNFIHSDPSYQSVWAISQMHVGPYQGPKYEKELRDAKAALKGDL